MMLMLVAVAVPTFAQDESTEADTPTAAPADNPAGEGQGEELGSGEGGQAPEGGEGAEPPQDQGEKADGQKQPQKGPGGNGGGSLLQGPWFFIIIIGGFLLLYIWMGRSRRKQQAQRREMLSNLRKGDKITTIGGIVGTIVDTAEDEVTIRVDDASNTRMKFARWAVRGVGPGSKEEQGQQENK